MPRRTANLCSVYLDLAARYGDADPLVQDLKHAIDVMSAKPPELPHGERRKVSLPRAIWSQQRAVSPGRRLGGSAKALFH